MPAQHTAREAHRFPGCVPSHPGHDRLRHGPDHAAGRTADGCPRRPSGAARGTGHRNRSREKGSAMTAQTTTPNPQQEETTPAQASTTLATRPPQQPVPSTAPETIPTWPVTSHLSPGAVFRARPDRDLHLLPAPRHRHLDQCRAHGSRSEALTSGSRRPARERGPRSHPQHSPTGGVRSQPHRQGRKDHPLTSRRGAQQGQ